MDMAVVMGEIQECLFSVVAQQSLQQIRIQNVRRLALRLMDIQNAVKSVRASKTLLSGPLLISLIPR